MGFKDLLKRVVLGVPNKVVHVPLNPDSVSDNVQVRAMSFENSELKGENAKLKSMIAQMKEREIDKNEEDNVKEVLDSQKNQLRLKSKGKFFSQKKFWARYFRDKKFRKSLGFYSFDRSTKLYNFGDICFSGDGSIALFDDEGGLIIRLDRAKDIFQSTGALSNDIAKGMIPLNMDKSGSYIENIMDTEMPELIPNNEGKLWFAKARKRPVYEIIQDLNNRIGDLSSDLEEAEATIIEKQTKIDKLVSENRMSQSMSEVSRAELSHQEQQISGIDASFRNLQRSLSNSQNVTVIQEDTIRKLESELQQMREKAEREGVKLSDEKAMEVLQDIRSSVVNEMPDNYQRSYPEVQQGSLIKKENT